MLRRPFFPFPVVLYRISLISIFSIFQITLRRTTVAAKRAQVRAAYHGSEAIEAGFNSFISDKEIFWRGAEPPNVFHYRKTGRLPLHPLTDEDVSLVAFEVEDSSLPFIETGASAAGASLKAPKEVGSVDNKARKMKNKGTSSKKETGPESLDSSLIPSTVTITETSLPHPAGPGSFLFPFVQTAKDIYIQQLQELEKSLKPPQLQPLVYSSIPRSVRSKAPRSRRIVDLSAELRAAEGREKAVKIEGEPERGLQSKGQEAQEENDATPTNKCMQHATPSKERWSVADISNAVIRVLDDSSDSDISDTCEDVRSRRKSIISKDEKLISSPNASRSSQTPSKRRRSDAKLDGSISLPSKSKSTHSPAEASIPSRTSVRSTFSRFFRALVGLSTDQPDEVPQDESSGRSETMPMKDEITSSDTDASDGSGYTITSDSDSPSNDRASTPLRRSSRHSSAVQSSPVNSHSPARRSPRIRDLVPSPSPRKSVSSPSTKADVSPVSKEHSKDRSTRSKLTGTVSQAAERIGVEEPMKVDNVIPKNSPGRKKSDAPSKKQAVYDKKVETESETEVEQSWDDDKRDDEALEMLESIAPTLLPGDGGFGYIRFRVNEELQSHVFLSYLPAAYVLPHPSRFAASPRWDRTPHLLALSKSMSPLPSPSSLSSPFLPSYFSNSSRQQNPYFDLTDPLVHKKTCTICAPSLLEQDSLGLQSMRSEFKAKSVKDLIPSPRTPADCGLTPSLGQENAPDGAGAALLIPRFHELSPDYLMRRAVSLERTDSFKSEVPEDADQVPTTPTRLRNVHVGDNSGDANADKPLYPKKTLTATPAANHPSGTSTSPLRRSHRTKKPSDDTVPASKGTSPARKKSRHLSKETGTPEQKNTYGRDKREDSPQTSELQQDVNADSKRVVDGEWKSIHGDVDPYGYDRKISELFWHGFSNKLPSINDKLDTVPSILRILSTPLTQSSMAPRERVKVATVDSFQSQELPYICYGGKQGTCLPARKAGSSSAFIPKLHIDTSHSPKNALGSSHHLHSGSTSLSSSLSSTTSPTISAFSSTPTSSPTFSSSPRTIPLGSPSSVESESSLLPTPDASPRSWQIASLVRCEQRRVAESWLIRKRMYYCEMHCADGDAEGPVHAAWAQSNPLAVQIVPHILQDSGRSAGQNRGKSPVTDRSRNASPARRSASVSADSANASPDEDNDGAKATRGKTGTKSISKPSTASVTATPSGKGAPTSSKKPTRGRPRTQVPATSSSEDVLTALSGSISMSGVLKPRSRILSTTSFEASAAAEVAKSILRGDSTAQTMSLAIHGPKKDGESVHPLSGRGSLPYLPNQPPPFDPMVIGSLLDVKDGFGSWWVAQVIDVQPISPTAQNQTKSSDTDEKVSSPQEAQDSSSKDEGTKESKKRKRGRPPIAPLVRPKEDIEKDIHHIEQFDEYPEPYVPTHKILVHYQGWPEENDEWVQVPTQEVLDTIREIASKKFHDEKSNTKGNKLKGVDYLEAHEYSSKLLKESVFLSRLAPPLFFASLISTLCHVCGQGAADEDQPLILCDEVDCGAAYHLDCVKLKKVPSGAWICPAHKPNKSKK